MSAVVGKLVEPYSGFDPRTIPSCALWLDGKDPLGNGTLPSNGVSVSTWTDKSGSNNSPTSSSGTYPTYSLTSNAVVWTGGAQQLTFPTTISNAVVGRAFTVFCVERRTASGVNFFIRGATELTNSNLLIGYNTSNTRRFAFYGNDIDSTVPAYSAGESATISCFMYSKPGRTIFNSGALTPSASNTNASDLASWTGASLGGNVVFSGYNGLIYEILIYAASMTSNERQQIEGYLGWKWALQTSIPVTHPYRGYVRPFTRPFRPIDISGCALWLDAADRSTILTSGTTSNVVQWSDKSGNSNNATGGVSPTYSSLSNSIQFNGSSFLSTPYTANPAAETLFAVATFTGTTDNTSYAIVGPSTTATNTRGYCVFRGIGTNNGVAWDIYGIGQRGNTSGVLSNVRFLTTGVYAPSSMSTGLNGGPQSTPAANSFGGTATTVIGRVANIFSYVGSINEIILYSRALTVSQYRVVEGYLADKWGLRGSLLPNAGFAPTQIPGCALWFDATDAASYSLSGTTLTALQDKSGNAANVNNLYGSTVTVQSNAMNGLPAFNLTNGRMSGAFAAGGTPANYTHTAFLVAKMDVSGSMALAFAQSATGSSVFFRVLDNYLGNFRTVAFFADTHVNNVPQQLTSNFLWSSEYSGASNSSPMLTRYNASNAVSVTVTTRPASNATHYFIGTDGFTNSQSANTWKGLIGEIVIYNGVLLTQQRQQVEGYLANKWGITGSNIIVHPFRSIVPLYPAFTPLQIPGCALWLDAADRSTFTFSGSNVTAWADKSGAGRNASSAGASNPILNNNSVVFSGSERFSTSYSSTLTNENFFIVFRTTASTSFILAGGSGTGQRFFYVDPASSRWIYLGAIGVWGAWNTVPIAIGTRHLTGFSWSSPSTRTLFLNGSALSPLTTISTPGAFTGTPTSTSIGDGLTGEISEIVSYDVALTIPQRQQIEGYLANKWGVGLVTPTAVPTAYSNCALWLDAADTSTIDLSGSNVTVWRDKSGNNYNASNVANKGPTYSGGVLNFNGTSNSLSVPTFTMPSSNHCLIAVHRPTTITGNNQGNTNIFRWQAPFYIAFPYMNGTTPRGYVSSTATSVIDALTSTLVERSVTTGYNVITANMASNSQLIYRNSVLMSSNNQPMKPSQTMSNFAIGSTVDTLSEFYQGSIAEMIIFSRTLTSDERTAIENRLISKWNTGGLLPEHPFKRLIA